MDHADPELEAGPQQVYDHVRRSFGGLHLTPGSYTEIFTGSNCSFDELDETFPFSSSLLSRRRTPPSLQENFT
jgi:hypothetical protein